MTDDEKLKVLTKARATAASAPWVSKYGVDEIDARINELKTKRGGGGPPELNAKRKATSFADQVRQTHQPGEGSGGYNPQHDDGLGGEGDDRLAGFNQRVDTMIGGAGAVADAALHPIETVQNPAKMRQFVRGGLDVSTLGYGQQLADTLHEKDVMPKWFPGNTPETVGRRPFAETERDDMLEEPEARAGGSLVTSFLPNPISFAGKLAGPLVGAVGSRIPVPRVLSGMPAGVMKSLANYELIAPAAAAAHADSSGNRLEAAKEAALDPLALMFATGAGAGGGMARKKAAKIRDPRMPAGRVIQDVEAAKGKIKMFGDEPVQGGLYESPELQSVGRGREGVQKLASDSVGRINASNESKVNTARQQYREQLDNIIASQGDKPHPTTRTHAALDEMEAENTIKAGRKDAVAGNKEVAKAIRDVREMLTQTGDEVLDPDATLEAWVKKNAPQYGEELKKSLKPKDRQQIVASAQATGEAAMKPDVQQVATARDIVKTRKIVRGLATDAYKAGRLGENAVYEKVLDALDADAEQVDPRIKQMNAEYAKAMVPVETSNDMVFGKKKKQFEMNEAARTTGVQRLGTMTDDTQSGTNRQLADRLAALGPDYEREVKLMRAKKAMERLRRGEPQVSTAIEKTGERAARGAAAGRTIGSLLANVPGFLAGFGIDKLRENPLPNQVRVTLPISEAVGSKLTGSYAPKVDVITGVAARRGKKKRDQGAEVRSEGARH